MRRFTIILLAIPIFLFIGCKRDIDPEEIYGLAYVNQTDYSVKVTLKGDSMQSPELSVVIPERSNENGTIVVPVTRFPSFDTCSFTFGDGRQITYVKGTGVDKHEKGNPIWIGSYEFSVIEGEGIFYFHITDAHYRQAE